jgi:hypothetical protein
MKHDANVAPMNMMNVVKSIGMISEVPASILSLIRSS